MKKRFFILCLSLLIITGCGSVELANGEKAVVTFKDKEGISSNELYENLKTSYGVEHLINMVDTLLLEKEYDTTTEETSYINQVISSVKNTATQYSINFLEYIQTYYGIQTEKDFEDYIILNYRRNLWVKDFAKENVTDKQIKDYYETKAIGDIEASHILIAPETTSSMTDNEKDEAETKALNLAKDIIKKLNNGEDFEKLAQKYSDDSSNASSGGYLGLFNRGKMDDNFEEAAVKLKVGEYSKTPVKSAFGYHIIFKKSQKDKPSLKDAKDDIISIIADETIENDSTISSRAIQALRKKYDMEIKDSELKSAYTNSLK